MIGTSESRGVLVYTSSACFFCCRRCAFQPKPDRRAVSVAASRFWPKADLTARGSNVRFQRVEQTWQMPIVISAFDRFR
jgi:hypothetical protein